MSTLEKAINLLHEMPERELENVYMYMRFIISRIDDDKDSLEKSMSGLEVLRSFAGVLPEDFDYEKELEEARDEKYGRFN